jgi:hypothetical protein
MKVRQLMEERPFLSKSTFIRGLQCEKSLYLHKKRPFLRDKLSEEQLAKFKRGHKLGVIARDLFPGGVDLSPPSHFQMAAAIRKTAMLTDAGTPVLYEAAFQHKGVRVALDILVKENGSWKGVEVKSSRAISDTFLWDAALQYYVISGSGLSLNAFSIAYIHPDAIPDYEVGENPVPGELFVIEDVMERILERQPDVSEKIERFREVNKLTRSPDIPVGPHCHYPYPCDFIGHCWKNVEGGVPGKPAQDHDSKASG